MRCSNTIVPGFEETSKIKNPGLEAKIGKGMADAEKARKVTEKNTIKKATPMRRVTQLGGNTDQLTSDEVTIIGEMRMPMGAGPDGTTNYFYNILSDEIYEAELNKGTPSNEAAGKAIVGNAKIFKDDSTGQIRGITNIEIKPKHRNKGFGKKLLNAFKSSPADLVSRTFKIVDIDKNAMSFWKKLGMQKSEDSFSTSDGGTVSNGVFNWNP